MRKITSQAITAFENKENFRSSNTEVVRRVYSDGYNDIMVTELLLHGHRIAHQKDGGSLFIDMCGWPTPTTRERLNALPGVNIHQHNWEQYLNGRLWHEGNTCLDVWNMEIEKEAK